MKLGSAALVERGELKISIWHNDAQAKDLKRKARLGRLPSLILRAWWPMSKFEDALANDDQSTVLAFARGAPDVFLIGNF